MAKRMSENERVLFFCLLFPPLWLFIPAIILCYIGDSIKDWYRGIR